VATAAEEVKVLVTAEVKVATGTKDPLPKSSVSGDRRNTLESMGKNVLVGNVLSDISGGRSGGESQEKEHRSLHFEKECDWCYLK
jgi:hypothetical protein